MRIEHIILYTIDELKKNFPEVFNKIFQKYQESIFDVPWSSEIIDSLKKLVKKTGYELRNYNIGAYSNSYIQLSYPSNTDDMTGRRAFAWLENVVLSDLRIPFKGKRRWEVAKYGQYYRPAMVTPCPFTGCCFDEDFLDSLKSSLKAGETVRDAILSLADTAGRLFEEAMEDEMSENAFVERYQDAAFDEKGRKH